MGSTLVYLMFFEVKSVSAAKRLVSLTRIGHWLEPALCVLAAWESEVEVEARHRAHAWSVLLRFFEHSAERWLPAQYIHFGGRLARASWHDCEVCPII